MSKVGQFVIYRNLIGLTLGVQTFTLNMKLALLSFGITSSRRVFSSILPGLDTTVRQSSKSNSQVCTPKNMDSDSSPAAVGDSTVEETLPTPQKSLRKRFALLLSFLGHNYNGMQFNNNGPTIEGEFFKALAKAGYCDCNPSEASSKLQFNRVSRTDAGVSALRQVVSLMLPVDVNIEKINEHLPSAIRVIAAQRVVPSLHVQKACESRTYSYIIPTFAFCPYREEPECNYSYRINVDSLYTLNDLLKAFEGWHKFHNYTKGRDMMDARSKRFIKKFHCTSPYMMGETEVIDLRVTGASFMLHHIRKMVGMVSAIMRGKVPPSMLQETFSHPKLPTPLAPGIGLLLESVNFDSYYKKHGNGNLLRWEEYDAALENFKMNTIVPFMVQYERKNNIIGEFLDSLRRHSFKDLRSIKIEEEEVSIRREIEEINVLLKEVCKPTYPTS